MTRRDARYHLEQERMCRRLAASATDAALRRQLLGLADEHRAAAQGTEPPSPAEPANEPPNPA